MNQKRRRGVEGVRAEVIDRGLFEGCCRLLAGQEQLEQHQNCSISNNPSPQVWRGQTEILPITENEVSTPPTIVKGATWEWLQPSSPSYSTSLVHYSVVSIWQGGGIRIGFYHHLTPPRPPELYPRRCLWGGWQDVRPTRRSKSPLQVNVPLLSVTFSTPIGLTSQMHARLGLQ